VLQQFKINSKIKYQKLLLDFKKQV